MQIDGLCGRGATQADQLATQFPQGCRVNSQQHGGAEFSGQPAGNALANRVFAPAMMASPSNIKVSIC
jgi:hypothetical protein